MLEKRQYTGLHIVGGGKTFLMQMFDGVVGRCRV